MNINKITWLEFFLWLFVFVLLLTLLSPLAIGYKIKNDYPERLKNLSNILNVEINPVKYERHFFSSTLDLTLKIPGFSETILYKEKIIHGPVYFGLLAQGKSPFVAAVVQGELNKGTSNRATAQSLFLQKIFSNNDTFVYQVTLSYLGDINSQLYLPALNSRFQDKMGLVSIYSAGIVINQHYSPVTQKIRADINIASIKFKSKHFALNAEAVNLSFMGLKGLNELLIGDSIVSVSLLDFYSGENQFAVKDMVLRSVSSEQSHLIDVKNKLSIRELLSSNQKFGPLAFDLNIKGINVESLKSSQQHQRHHSELTQETVAKSEFIQLLTLNSDFINQIEISISPFSIDSELGKLRAKLMFKIDETTLLQTRIAADLLSAIDLDLDVSIDDLLLKQFVLWGVDENIQNLFNSPANANEADALPVLNVDKRIQGMLKNNWLVNREAGYRSKISLQKGELHMNNATLNTKNDFTSAAIGVADIDPF